MDIGAWNQSQGATVWLWDCTKTHNENQHWHYKPETGEIISLMDGQCLDIESASMDDGARIQSTTNSIYCAK